MAGKEESDQNLEAGSTASAGAFTGKEFSLKLTREDIAGKQESSLKLCPAESMKLLPGEEECSLRLCPTKRKAPTAGYLPPLKGGAIKSKGEDYCSEGDIASTDAVLSEDVDKGTNATVLADVTMVEIEEQAISDTKVAAATQKGAPGTGFSEVGKYGDPKVQSHKTMGEEDENEEEDGDEEDGEDEEDEDEDEEDEEDEDEEDEETKGTAPHATVVLGGVKYSYQVKDYSSEDSEVEDDWDVHTEGEYFDDSEAEYQVVVEKANAKLNRFMERLRARTKTSVSKDDFGDYDDEEVCA